MSNKSSTRQIGGETAKGYKKESFLDAFRRYTLNCAVTTSQTTVDAGSSPIGNVTHNPIVTDKNQPQASIDAGCDGVTDENREIHRLRV